MEQKKLQEIFNMTLKLSDQENVNLQDVEIEEDRKEWLQEVIQKTLESDDSSRIVKMTRLFLTYEPDATYSDERMDELYGVYDEIEYLVEGFDIGKLFNSLGGMKHNLDFLAENPHPTLKIRAANLIGVATHNNPTVQATILECKGMELILEYIQTSTNDNLVIKCLYAISTLIGSFEDAEKRFAELGDDKLFVKLLNSLNSKIKTKAAFLLMKLCNSDVVPVERFVTRELIRTVMEHLKSDHEEWHEHLLNLLIPCFQKSDLNSLFSNNNEKSETVHLIKDLLFQYTHSKHDMTLEIEIQACKSILDIFQVNSEG